MLKHPIFAWSLVLCLCTAAACSRDEGEERTTGDRSEKTGSRGDDAAIETIRAAARALAEPNPTVDYVAAEMEGVIKARTKSQALIHYDGYRATLTTPGDRVTVIKFELTEAKPSVAQLAEEFGEYEDHRKGVSFDYQVASTGARLVVLAEPVEQPADMARLVRRVTIQGARTR